MYLCLSQHQSIRFYVCVSPSALAVFSLLQSLRLCPSSLSRSLYIPHPPLRSYIPLSSFSGLQKGPAERGHVKKRQKSSKPRGPIEVICCREVKIAAGVFFASPKTHFRDNWEAIERQLRGNLARQLRGNLTNCFRARLSIFRSISLKTWHLGVILSHLKCQFSCQFSSQFSPKMSIFDSTIYWFSQVFNQKWHLSVLFLTGSGTKMWALLSELIYKLGLVKFLMLGPCCMSCSLSCKQQLAQTMG